MKQSFQHIILIIILALAWSGEVWGITRDTNNYEVFSKAKEFHVYSASTLYDYYSDIYTLNDVPGIIAFEAKGDGGLTGNNKDKFYVQVSTDKKNWSNLNSNELSLKSGTYQDFSFIITNTAVRYLRFKNAKGAKYSRYVRNLYVTRGKTLSFSSNNFTTSTTSIDFGSIKTGSSKKETVRLYYNNICKTNKLKLSSNNGNFIVPSNVTIESNGYVDVDVTFSPNSVGKKSGTVTLYLEAVTSYGQTISRKDVTISVSGTGLPFFGFSATANKIYNHGAVEATVNNSEIVGVVSDTQASTQATFTATPNANCTFEGWYEDAEHTKPASADNSYKNQTFKPTIINTSIGSTKTLTLYAYFKANQTLTWTHPDIVNIVNEVTTEGAAAATAKSAVTGTATQLAVTYSSSNSDVASVDEETGDVTGVSVPAAPGNIVTITARQAGNAEFNPVEATRQFTVINKYQAIFNPSFTVTAGAATFCVDDTETITCTDLGEGFTYNSSDPTVVSISESDGVITLNALKVGTSTITLTQPPTTTHYAASATYNVTVTKVPNNLKFSLAGTDILVDGTIAVTFTDQNNTGTPIVGRITEQTLSSGVNQTINNETPVITYANGVITARNAGTAKITFSQAQTDKYAAWTSAIYDITVTKLSNPISITLAGGSSTNIKLKYGATASLSYTYANTTGAAPTVTRTSGSYTTYSAGTITAGNAQGTDIYEIRQAESYKYEAGLATFTLRVNNSDEVEGYVYAGWMDGSEFSWSTIGGTDALTVNGPAEKLKFQAKATDILWVWSSDNFYAQYHANGSWTTGLEPNIKSKDQWFDFECNVPENTDQVKIFTETGAVGNKQLRNIRVTRKTYIRESHDTSKDNLGTVLTGNTATSATITVSYSSTNGGNINISSNNSHFVPSISSISVETNKTAQAGNYTYICGVDGTQTLTVTYTPDPDQLGEETAVITIGDLFYSQTITLTATAAKRTNTLAIIEDQSVKVEDVISNVYSSKNSDATITPTIENIEGENVISYNLSTNEITAVGAGTARLTLTQPATDSHYGATKSVTVTVSKYNQTVNWNNDLDDEARTLEVGVSPVLTTNKATASSGLDVTYSSSNPAALAVDATTGDLTALSGPATVTITATQAGNYKYKSASITRTFTIIQKEEVTITTTLSESGTNFFPIGSDDITIRPSAPVTVSALVITGDEDAISVSFANNTFTLHALEEGTVTVTLTRAADEGYYALSKTYTIQVVKPVLVLVPTETPVIEYEDYSRVTLSRTLPAGYSSLALPFSTTVATLTGRAANANDWVAQLETVTYSQADGYTLYFNKVSSGDITANQPYILHLGAEVVNPAWTNVTLSAATATEITASAGYGNNVGAIGIYSDWSMTSNFEVGMSMNGKYGVVNSAGGLKKGGSSATLNAFSAYITPPTGSAGIKVRSAFTDEFGETTYINGLPDEDATASDSQLYDLSGRRVNAHQPKSGIYVLNGRRIVVK